MTIRLPSKARPATRRNCSCPACASSFSLLYAVTKHPWVQVAAGQIGVVIAQVGDPLPIGAKSADLHVEFRNLHGSQRIRRGRGGKERRSENQGTKRRSASGASSRNTGARPSRGLPGDHQAASLWHPGFRGTATEHERWSALLSGLGSAECRTSRGHEDRAKATEGGRVIDMVGSDNHAGRRSAPCGRHREPAGRIRGYQGTRGRWHADQATNSKLIETILGSKNDQHNSYQDFQTFLDKGGKIGLQHDPLLYGAYNLNPFLVSVEQVPMLVVEQGQVAVIKSYVGLPTEDTSGAEFKFGSLVRPGHRGIWEEPLRTGKYPINPRIYQAEIVPTAILKLDWSKGITGAHKLDERLEPIIAKSREGFVFTIDLQVLIHVPDTKAPRVISMVGSMLNLVNEVLQAAVGNLFRDKLGGMPAVTFIETRQIVQQEALAHISEQLSLYEVETKGVYIQDVILPDALVQVLTQREIANQEVETFKKQRAAQDQRIETEAATGKADMQKSLAASEVTVMIKKNNADSRAQEARGEAEFTKQTGLAQADVIRAQGVARADGFKAQNEAIGASGTLLVNVATVLADRNVKIMPDILVSGGGSALDGLAATLTQAFAGKSLPSTASKS